MGVCRRLYTTWITGFRKKPQNWSLVLMGWQLATQWNTCNFISRVLILCRFQEFSNSHSDTTSPTRRPSIDETLCLCTFAASLLKLKLHQSILYRLVNLSHVELCKATKDKRVNICVWKCIHLFVSFRESLSWLFEREKYSR